MSDDAKLKDASKHFSAKKFEECKKALKGLPADDPKISHNLAIIGYLAQGGNHNVVVDELNRVPSLVKDIPAPTGGFSYEGHEYAFYNKGVVLLHCGQAEEAAKTFEFLASRASVLPKALQLRVACLLHVATASSGKLKHRNSVQDELINKIISDPEVLALTGTDKQLQNMMSVALSDGPALHDWFKNSSKNQTDKAIYFNNLGVQAMNDGKAGVASLYLARASKEAADANADSTFVQAIAYNAALCNLSVGNPQVALDCFNLCQGTMKGSPMLWVRVAQACVTLYAAAAEKEGNKIFEKVHRGVVESVSEGAAAAGASHFTHLPTSEVLYPLPSGKEQEDLLATAAKAITTALYLLPSVADVKAGTHSVKSQTGQSLQYALLYGAFVDLTRGDYASAVTFTNQLLSMHLPSTPLIPEVHTAALSYAAEALCQLNRPEQALRTLSNAALSDLVAGGDRATAQQKSAVEGLFINLCIAHILNGSWKQAQNLVNTIVTKFPRTSANQSSIPAKAAALLEIYLELAMGNRERAVELLSIRPASVA